MTMILSGSAAAPSFTVQLDGAVLPIAGDVTAQVFSMDGRTEFVAGRSISDAEPGADWPAGRVVVPLTALETGAIPPGDAMLVLAGAFGLRRYRLVVETLALGTRTSLFIRDIVVDEIRRDRLMSAAAGILQDIKVSDQYLWDKVRAAESDLSHTLRVPLVPTRYFPAEPTTQERAALGDMAWEIDPGYDYDPAMFERNKWGYIITRNRPIISVEALSFSYTRQTGSLFNMPLDWLRIDSRVGHIRIVPIGPSSIIGSAGLALGLSIANRSIPDMVQVSYTAGLKNAAADYPELLDVVKKKAVLKIVADAFLPQSGSISADGLSQSISVDMDKYSSSIEEIINGPKGANGGLMTAIHGIRSMVF